MATILKTPFGQTRRGHSVDLYTLTNRFGRIAKVMTYGAILTELWTPNRDGALGDVVLGFDELEPYETKSPHFGSTIGRVGNRIAKGKFELNGRKFSMVQNNGANHLHGGTHGYDRRLWSAHETISSSGASVMFSLFDPDGEEGYPGNVEAKVAYTLTDEDVLRIEYWATTDQATPINLTNHTYFNLRDAGVMPILDHVLTIYADLYTPVDDTLIPTGELAPVAGTPLNFTEPKPIGRDLRQMANDPQGYDHNFVLRGKLAELKQAADLFDPASGRRMETWTTEPGVQFYSGNFLDGTLVGKGGAVYRQHHALCLETQHFPDSVNQPQFPNTILQPGETYHQLTEYRFFTQ